jgi:hypothetical protein
MPAWCETYMARLSEMPTFRLTASPRRLEKGDGERARELESGTEQGLIYFGSGNLLPANGPDEPYGAVSSCGQVVARS